MNYINKALLTAALGSSLLALEACRKCDTNRLTGRWKLVGGINFSPNREIIFDFEADGDFTEERIYNGFFIPYSTTNTGNWKWLPGKKLGIDLDYGSPFVYGYGFSSYDRKFEVVLIKGNDMELEDENRRDWEFKRE